MLRVCCRFDLSAYTLRFVYALSFFFFYCSGDHRDLHSFPTRRSSDLGVALYPTIVQRLIVAPNELVKETPRSEEHTSELQSHSDLVCRLLLEKKKNTIRKKQKNKQKNRQTAQHKQTDKHRTIHERKIT